MRLAETKVRLLLWLLMGYLLLSYTFMQVRIPPSALGIPLGELFLVFALFTTNLPLVLSRMSSVVSLVPFLVWWSFGIGGIVAGVLHNGPWALRDGTQVVESLYVIVGFAVAGDPKVVERVMRYMPVALAVICIYGLGFPFQDEIAALSPKFPGAQGEAVPIFGYTTTPAIMLWTAFYCLIGGRERPGLGRSLLAYFLIAFALFVVQTRTSYLQILGLGALVLIFRSRSLGRLSLAIPAVLVLLGLIEALQIQLPGRLTDKVSASFIIDHFAAIFGQADTNDAALTSAAEGTALRLHWWLNIYDQLTRDAVTMLTGLGYGIPLTDFRDTLGNTVREPHNSFISVIARLGIIGFSAWLWMQIALFVAAVRGCLQYRRLGIRQGEDFLLMVVAFAVLTLISAFGEDAMEKPYNAIPYYAFFGFALRVAFALRSHARRSRDAADRFGPAPDIYPISTALATMPSGPSHRAESVHGR